MNLNISKFSSLIIDRISYDFVEGRFLNRPSRSVARPKHLQKVGVNANIYLFWHSDDNQTWIKFSNHEMFVMYFTHRVKKIVQRQALLYQAPMVLISESYTIVGKRQVVQCSHSISVLFAFVREIHMTSIKNSPQNSHIYGYKENFVARLFGLLHFLCGSEAFEN